MPGSSTTPGYSTIEELTFVEVQKYGTRHKQHLVYMGETQNGKRHGWGVEYAVYHIDGKRTSYEFISRGMWENNLRVTFGPETVQKRDTSLLERWGRNHLINQCSSKR
jgi:hypothetical protein